MTDTATPDDGVERTVGGLEREVKLAAGPRFALPDLDGVAPGVTARRTETIDLDATYYDTADLRLARRGVTLRHRRRGVRGTWTLKLPSDDGGDGDDVAAAALTDAALERRELDLDGPSGDVPRSLADLVAADVRTAALAPVARLQTRRKRTVVRDRDGGALAEIDDDEVSVLDGGRVAARFRELEVELAEGAGPEVVDALVSRLVDAGAGRADPTPKLVTALGPPARAPGELAPTDLGDDPTAGEVVTAALRAATRRIIDHHAPALRGVDPEGVHQMRVGTRRLRSDLRTFRPLLDRARSDPVRAELRELADALGAVRDPDVLLSRLRRTTAALDDVPDHAADGLFGRLEARRDRAAADLADTLISRRYRTLLDGLVDLAVDPPLAADADGRAAFVLPTLVAPRWKKLRRAVRSLDRHPPDEELHAIRKRAKQVRYAVEAVAPVVGRNADKAARRLARVQDVLGDHQDTTVAEAWLVEAASEASGPEAFLAGVLVGVERTERVALRAQWPDSWARVDKGSRWAWLP